MFKVSKQPSWSATLDMIIFRWCHNPLVVKNLTKQPWLKIENSCNFDYDYPLSRGKIWLWLFYTFLSIWFHDSTQKISSHFEQNWRRDSDLCNFHFFLFFFQCLSFKVWTLLPYWGTKASNRAHRALGGQRASSPPQELEGWARSAQNF